SSAGSARASARKHAVTRTLLDYLTPRELHRSSSGSWPVSPLGVEAVNDEARFDRSNDLQSGNCNGVTEPAAPFRKRSRVRDGRITVLLPERGRCRASKSV